MAATIRSQGAVILRQQKLSLAIKADNRALRTRCTSLEKQVGDLLGAGNPEGSFSRADAAEPEFCLVGLDRKGAGKRLMASRNLAGTTMTMTDEKDPPPRWKLAAVMSNMLLIDKPTFGEALDHMGMIWRNWERDAREQEPVKLEVSYSEKLDWAKPRIVPELER
jgi:hypothetical protein